MRLRKYWFKFKLTMNEPHPVGTLLGCGVTAFSKDDALDLLRQRVFRSCPIPLIERYIEDVELSDLDAKHVLPNIADSSQRGVWFPLGYQADPDTPQVE